MKLIIEVDEIKGSCPVYNRGDRIVLDEGYRVNLALTDNICMHSLASLLPYYIALSKGVDPADLGLAGENGCAYLQCLDPLEITGGGTVIFRISRIE
ncbi:MAG: TIGR04076 family protein [Candidatus Aminicenantes bacterium]|nr:TIGR04076 family protein [Candidatus Aminicenantes bacterium]